MTVHSLYPSFILVHYTSGGRNHKQVLPVIANETVVPGVWELTHKDGSTDIWTIDVDAYTALMKANLGDDTGSIQYAELFTLATEDADPLFVANYAIGVAGTATQDTNQFCEAVTTFRSATGGLYRNYVMDTWYGEDIVATFPFGASGLKSMADYLVSDNSFVVARDGGVLVTPVRIITKTNDALRKRAIL